MGTLNCTKFMKKYYNVSNYFTPIKIMALMVLALGLVDNLTSPLQHALGGGTLIYTKTILEWIIRISFIICGILGLQGRRISRRARATIVSLPLLYLSIFYLLLLFEYSNDVFLALIILTGIPALWMLFFGDNYD